jgi:two-component system, response regulator YesN
MYNVLIVDDDQIVLDGLSQYVNWADLGFRVASLAISAQNALKAIESEYVDVLLTDIVMPAQNGFELIKEAREINPNLKIVN